MKKAILVEPKLLADIKQKSPAIYEYYCNSPFSWFEYIDYGINGEPYFIQKEVFGSLDKFEKEGCQYVPQVLLAFQAGYAFGLKDLNAKYGGHHTDILKVGIIAGVLLNLALNYPYYTEESLFSVDNFEMRDGILYSKCTYKEAQYFEAWREIFRRHDLFNELFIDINYKRKMENLDNMGVIDFSGAWN